jgi:hypothetical protein
MMMIYEKNTGKPSTRFVTDGIHSAGIEVWHFEYIEWLEAKASSYDRLLAKKLTDEELDSPPASKILKEMAEKAEAYDSLMSMNSVSENEIRIVLDGNAWCAYRMPFRNLQEDDAGFGSTPQMALTALLEVELPYGRDDNHA